MLEEILCAGPLLGRRGDASLESRCLSEAKWEDEEEKHSRKMEQQMQSLQREQAWSTAGTGKSL